MKTWGLAFTSKVHFPQKIQELGHKSPPVDILDGMGNAGGLEDFVKAREAYNLSYKL